MMRKLLSLTCILSMTSTPVLSAPIFKSKVYGHSSAPKKASLLTSLLDDPQVCKAKQPDILNRRSQGNLFVIFENIACSGVDEHLGSSSLDLNYCQTVNKCVEFQSGEFSISDEDKVFLEEEALDFLMRENAQIEMGKYTNSENFQDLLSFIKKMPEKYKSKIGNCEQVKEVKNNLCTESTTEAKIAQHYIRTSLDKKTQSNASAALKSEDEIVDMMTGNTRRYNRKMFEVMDLAQNARMYQGAKTQAFSKVYDGALMREKERAESASNISSDFDPEKDSIVDSVFLDVLKYKNSEYKNNVMLIPADKFKEIVRESLLKASRNSNDYIFNYANRNTQEVIEKALNMVNFNQKDFIINPEVGRKALSSKINQIRVELAKSHLAEDCNKTTSSIAQVCTNISKKMQSGGALDLLNAYQEDPFKKMIDYYQKSDVQDKDKKIKKLETMRSARGQVFKKYLSYSLQVSICDEKFPKEISAASKRSQARSQVKSDKVDELEKAAEVSRASTIAALSETAKRNETFKKEIKAMGIQLNTDVPKSNLATVDLPLQQAKVEINDSSSRLNAFAESQKSFLPDNVNQNSNKNAKPFEPSISENMNNFNVIDDEKRERSINNSYEEKLRSKFAELESKEKAMAKKVSQANLDAAAADKVESTDELLDLRRQIEELKKSQVKAVADQKEAAVKSEEKVSEVRSSAKNGSIFGSKSSSSDSSERNDSTVAAASIVASNSQPAVFDNPQVDRAATRGPASAGFSGANSGAKGVGDKVAAAAGIILSKSGEVMQDTASILDNPKETEIAKLLEVTNGQPFLIRENGVLMKVTLALDTDGKPQKDKGRIRFKKEALSKAQQETIVKEANIQKSMKEIDRDPTRLFNLKSLLKETVKRE